MVPHPGSLIFAVMVRPVDKTGRHAHALESQADDEGQAEQEQGALPAVPLGGVQQGKGKAEQRVQRGHCQREGQMEVEGHYGVNRNENKENQ